MRPSERLRRLDELAQELDTQASLARAGASDPAVVAAIVAEYDTLAVTADEAGVPLVEAYLDALRAAWADRSAVAVRAYCRGKRVGEVHETPAGAVWCAQWPERLSPDNPDRASAEVAARRRAGAARLRQGAALVESLVPLEWDRPVPDLPRLNPAELPCGGPARGRTVPRPVALAHLGYFRATGRVQKVTVPPGQHTDG